MFDPQKLIQEIHEMEHGTARLEAISDAIAQADSENAHYWRLYFRFEFLTESNIHGDNFRGLLCFPEYLKIFDEHPELEEEMYQDVMWAFKWLLDNLPDFYQISLDQAEEYFDEFKRRSQKYGLSLRTYHMKHAKFYMNINQDFAQVAYTNFKHFPRGENSDCEACELNFDMDFALSQGELEKALEIARPLIAGEKRCAEIPQVTYARLSQYYLYHDNPEEALYYGILCERAIQNGSEFLKETGELLELFSVTDVGHGWKLFKYALQDFVRCKNPTMRMTFARGAYRLLLKVAEETEYSQSGFLKLLPVMPEEEGWSVKALADFFYEIADDIAEKIDKRNENYYFGNLMKKKLPVWNEQQSSIRQAQSAHGFVKKFQSAFIAVLSQTAPFAVVLRERIKALEPPFEVASVTMEDDTCYVSLKYDTLLFDMALKALPEESTPLQVQVSLGLDDEDLQSLEKIPFRALLLTELPGDGQKSYHVIMRLLYTLFPDMLAVVSASAAKAYSRAWVHFAGEYENAVSPEDVYSLYLSGEPNRNEVYMTTVGLGSLGMRELEILGANKENFGHYAAILDKTASFCAEYDHLPDENKIITTCYDDNDEYPLIWQNPASLNLPAGSYAARVERDAPAGVIAKEKLPAPETVEFSNTRKSFFRGMNLTRETFDLFLKVLPSCESALVKLSVEVSDEMMRRYGYAIEPLWAEVNLDSEPLTASLAEESEAVPEHQIGEIMNVNADTIIDWRIKMPSTSEIFSPDTLYLLEDAGL